MDTLPAHEVTEHLTETSLAGTISGRKNQILSCKNPSVRGEINSVLEQQNTATDCLNVTHLTEADQEFSDDFDENKNTVR